jgi:hypothetical protein
MDDADKRRDAVIRRLEAKRGFNVHAALYVIVNLLLMFIWGFSGAGYFWPVWPIVGWGVGLAFHGWTTYFEKPITEEDIRREMEKRR